MGLLDMFGPAPGGGLLDPSAYDPRMDIALGIAGQLLDNAGPSNTPRGMFQGVPQALMQGRQGAFQRQVQQQQYADMLASAAEKKRQREAQSRLVAMSTPAYTREAPTDEWQQQAPNVDQQGLLSTWMDADPAGASKFFGNLLNPEPYTLGEGDVRVQGGQIIGRGPSKPPPPVTPHTVQVEEGNETVTYQLNADGTRTKLGSGPRWNPNPTPSTMLNIDQRGETEADKAEGQVVGKQGGDLIVAGNRASDTIAQMDRLGQLAEAYAAAGGDFGPIAEAKLKAATFLPEWARQTMGITDDQLGTGQALMSEANRQVLGLIGPGGFPSNNFSEADRKFLLTIPPRLSDMGFEAKRLVALRVAERQEKMGERYQELRANNVGVGAALAQVQRESRQQPLFTEEERRTIASGSNVRAAAPAAGGQPPRISTVDEYNALPAGAPYIDPTGVKRVKGAR